MSIFDWEALDRQVRVFEDGEDWEHLTFAISIFTYYNKSYISGRVATIGFSN